jgi:hypothetical protein
MPMPKITIMDFKATCPHLDPPPIGSRFYRAWRGKLWYISVTRRYTLCVDWRKNWLADMFR